MLTMECLCVVCVVCHRHWWCWSSPISASHMKRSRPKHRQHTLLSVYGYIEAGKDAIYIRIAMRANIYTYIPGRGVMCNRIFVYFLLTPAGAKEEQNEKKIYRREYIHMTWPMQFVCEWVALHVSVICIRDLIKIYEMTANMTAAAEWW